MGIDERLSCPPEEEILLLDTADETERARVRAHAATCANCARRLAALDDLDSALGEDDDAVPGHLLVAARALPDREPAAPARPGRILRLAAAGVAAAAALLALVSPWSADPAGPPKPAPAPEPAPAVARAVAFPEFPEPDLRTRVAAALACEGTEGARYLDDLGDSILILLTRLAEEDDATVARAAIARLGDLGRTEARPAIESALDREDLRPAAISALAELADGRSVRPLVALFADEESGPAAREAAARIGGDAAARALADWIHRRGPDVDPTREIGLLARADGREGTRRLLALLDDPSLRPSVLAAVAGRGEALLPHLTALAAGRERWDARRALHALAWLAPADAVPVLRRLLGERDRRDVVARALVAIDTAEAGEALLSRSLTDDVREAFRDAGPGLTAWLLERTRGGDTLSRLESVELLGLSGRPEAVPVLETLARHRAIAPSAIRALGRIGGSEGVAALARLAEEPRLARDAIEALGESGEPAAAPVLAGLADSDPVLANSVARALGRIPDEAAVSALLALEPDRSVGRALGKMDPKFLKPALEALLGGEQEEAARAALREFTADPRRPAPRRGGIH